MLPFPAGRRERESRSRRHERSTDDRTEIVQAPRAGADGQDRRELHRGARDAARRGRAEGDRAPAARDLRRGDPAPDRPRMGGVVRRARRVGRGGPHAPRDRALARRAAGPPSAGLERAGGGRRLRAHARAARRRRARRRLRDQRDQDRGGARRAALRRVRRRGRAGALAARRAAARAHGDEAEVGPVRLGRQRRPRARHLRGEGRREEHRGAPAQRGWRTPRRRSG